MNIHEIKKNGFTVKKTLYIYQKPFLNTMLEWELISCEICHKSYPKANFCISLKETPFNFIKNNNFSHKGVFTFFVLTYERNIMKTGLFKDISLETIISYIGGSKDEIIVSAVEKWLKKDIDHLVYFNKIKNVWLELSDVEKLNSSAIDSDWNKVLVQIKQQPINTQYQKIWFLKIWNRAAAVIIFIVSIAAAYLVGNYLPSSNAYVYEKPIFNEIIVPLGQKSQLVLGDGSKVWINAGSKLKFPSRFGGKVREVWLDGEAFFEVAKNRTIPFCVHTSDLNIKVHGTSFNVKAYNSEGTIETILVEGLVSIVNTKSGDSKEVFLKPNRKAIFIKNDDVKVSEQISRNIIEHLKPRKIFISEPFKVESMVSWKDGKIVFDNETFEEIAKKLERRYDVIIKIESEEIKANRLTGSFKNISVEQAINGLQLLANFNFSIKENEITIMALKKSTQKQ